MTLLSFVFVTWTCGEISLSSIMVFYTAAFQSRCESLPQHDLYSCQVKSPGTLGGLAGRGRLNFIKCVRLPAGLNHNPEFMDFDYWLFYLPTGCSVIMIPVAGALGYADSSHCALMTQALCLSKLCCSSHPGSRGLVFCS